MINNVMDYLSESAKLFPNKEALVDENRSLTFLETEYIAKQIAIGIVNKCGDIVNRPIAVYMHKSIEMLCSFFGIAYSGNFYSPIDIKMPLERASKIIEVLKPVAVIVDSDFITNGIPDVFSDITVIEYDECLSLIVSDDVIGRYRRILDVDPLYVLFTSGSTGMPKGVTICHRSVIDYTEWLKDTFDFDEKTIFGNQAPFYFDNSILDIYSTLKNGSTLVIIPENKFVFPGKVLEFLNEYGINTIFWVPSALIGVANSDAIDKIHLEHIEKILFCGEVMPNKQLNIWRRNYPSVLYANLYGPTEITDVCTYYVVDREFEDDESLPIGKACENTEILILGEDDKPVKKGEIGELCVRGICLSLGYYDNDEKTKPVFVQNPNNKLYRDLIYRTGDLVKLNERGEIIYLSRKDFQIKHQGHRIELGEIETATGDIEEIGGSCAVYDDENKKIILCCSINSEIEKKTVYNHLKCKLPKYMLPADIVYVDEFPLNLNGKIDRKRLKELI